jgi:hypothetical protein
MPSCDFLGGKEYCNCSECNNNSSSINEEELRCIIYNQKNKRKIIENELANIKDQTNLVVYMKISKSIYVHQDIEIIITKRWNISKINKRNETFGFFESKYDKYNFWVDKEIYPEIWKDFNYEPFFITCKNCNSSTQELNENKLYENNICYKCEVIIKKNKFTEKWKSMLPQEKLKLYGKEKLIKLAKIKKIKGYSKYTKNELINKLENIVTEKDFPIK